MNDELRTLTADILSNLVINGDLSKLSSAQKVELYIHRCHQAGLDPSAKPFDLLTLNGKQILYANAGATQQLTSTRNLSHQVTNRELVDGIYCVFVRVTGPDGRSTENMGAVPVDNLKGEAKANAMLKSTTKAIRRAVLAHCGLGLMDETEVETIPGAVQASLPLGTEWTEDERQQAGLMIADLAEIVMNMGYSEDEMKAKIQRPQSQIGDPEITFKIWGNRLAAFSERLIATLKKTNDTEAFTAHDA